MRYRNQEQSRASALYVAHYPLHGSFVHVQPFWFMQKPPMSRYAAACSSNGSEAAFPRISSPSALVSASRPYASGAQTGRAA